MERTAAALVIGNEVLTGKVQEANVVVLARELFSLGITLSRVVVCPDEHEVIISDLNALRASHDWVFTSGGIGPTHDDITIEAVAAAFGREVVRSAEIEQQIRGYHREATTSDHLRMAMMPEGAELVRSSDMIWPTIRIENVFVLPGVPEVFRAKMAALRDRLDTRTPFVSHAVYTRCDEGSIAALLSKLAAENPGVTIGSYLKWRDPAYRVKITFDGRDADAVARAADALVGALSPGDLVRREP